MIEFELLAWELLTWELLALELESQTLKTLLLILGAGISVWGLVLIRSHRVEFDLPTKELSRQEEGFARRKFYRRMTGSSLITCVGMCLAAMYWASHPKVYSSLTLVILCLLVLLFLVAVFDLFNVGIQAIVDPQNERREELVKEVLRLRQQAAESKKASEDEPESPASNETSASSD